MLKYTRPFLESLEQIVAENNFILRYEKGNFKSGYCIIKESRVIVVNKYFTLEGKINSLADILKTLDIDTAQMSEKSIKRYKEVMQSTASL
jgi:hypothetical protein